MYTRGKGGVLVYFIQDVNEKWLTLMVGSPMFVNAFSL